MKWSKMPTVVGKWVVIRYIIIGGGTHYGVFKIKNFRDFPATYKVVISPAKDFQEMFVKTDIYSMDLAGWLNENNVFDTYHAAKKYYNSVVK